LQSNTRNGLSTARRRQSRRQPLRQSLAVARATGGVAHGAQSQLAILDAERVEKRPDHLDRLGVGQRLRRTEQFGSDLMELPLPSLLGALVTEHRAEVVETLREARGDRAM